MRAFGIIVLVIAIAVLGRPALASCYTFPGDAEVRFDLGLAQFDPETIEPTACVPEAVQAALEVFEDFCVIEHTDDPDAEVIGTPEEIEKYMTLADTYCPEMYSRLVKHQGLIEKAIPMPNYNDPM